MRAIQLVPPCVISITRCSERSARLGLHRTAFRARGLWILCMALACTTAVNGETPSRATFVALSNSVVRVEAARTDGTLSVGSGVTVAPSVVVTNCHVIRDAPAVRVSGLGRLWEATGQHGDTLRDLCFLRVPTWSGNPVVLGSADNLREAQSVAALGFSGGTAISLKLGHVLALHSLDLGRIIESDTAFNAGASGGGLFDVNGALVGILTFRDRLNGKSFYSLPVEWIRDRLPAEGDWSALDSLGSAHPFWQGDTDTLPYFMRANLFESQGRWGAVLELADRWSSAFPQDSEALIMRGRAQQGLEHPRAAAAAFAEALRLAPDNPAAWYGLAIAYQAIGDKPALQRARAKLALLDEELAAQLEDELARWQPPGQVVAPPGVFLNPPSSEVRSEGRR
jgi:serine protease Do